MAKCQHCNTENYFYWTLQTNEEGWTCGECGRKPGEPEGFCPQLDRELIAVKVEAILNDLHCGKFVYVSNSEEGEYVVRDVAADCKVLGAFDQYTIVRLIMHNLSSHGDYWKTVSDGIIAGADPRQRCECGQLANCYVGDKSYCREHWPKLDAKQLV